MTDQNNDTEAFVLAELAVIRSGIPISWPRACLLLRAIEKSDYWKRDANSFTNWISHHSGELRINPPSLWRFHAAGRYYEFFRSEYPEICSLPLEQLPGRVSPENLELLYKLARVAPADVVSKLLVKVLNCTARRSELRAAWLAYRPIMEGRTARGRGASPPRPAAKETGRITEATILHGLISNPAIWTGVQDLLTYRLYMPSSEKDHAAGCDAIVATLGKTSGLRFHGIEVKAKVTLEGIKNLVSQVAKSALACDLMWIALPSDPESDVVAALPRNFGVIVVNEDGVKVVRPAQFTNGDHNTDKLAKLLLEQELSG